MTEQYSRAVAGWHYEAPYASYDLDTDADDLREFLDAAAWPDKRFARLSLRLRLDDRAYDKLLRDTLRSAPFHHHVVTPLEAGTLGTPDAVHLAYAARHDLVLVTMNPDDFLALHAANPNHAGILLICHDNRPSDMRIGDIARAIANLERTRLPLAGHVHTLNQWRY